MALTAGEISLLGFTTLNHYIRKRPEKQIAYALPFYRKMMEKKRNAPGGKEFIVEFVKTKYDSNMQAVKGDTTVTYNKRDNVRHANWAWSGYHVGLQLNEDVLAANGITVTDDQSKAKTASRSEILRLVNVLEDQLNDLFDGYEEDLNHRFLRDGTASADDIVGLDLMVKIDPTTGTVGGIDPAVAGNEYWRNAFKTGSTQANMVEDLEVMHRQIVRYGGKPDLILMGAEALDQFRAATKAEVSRYTILNTSGQAPTLDPSVTGLQFKGIEVLYDPSFEAEDVLNAPAAGSEWAKRCYMISCKHMKWRPIDGHDSIPRNPPRESSNYIHRWAHTTKGALTMDKRNAHGVLVIG